MKISDDSDDFLRIALCHAFIALAEGEGFLRAACETATGHDIQNINRICGKWSTAREEIANALSASQPRRAQSRQPDIIPIENAA